MSEPVDVCVVGAGAGGAVAAWALTRAGVRVLLLETGPRFDPAAFETHATGWELGPTPLTRVAEAEERRSWEAPRGAPLDPGYAHLASRSFSNLSGPRPTRRRPLVYARALGVGGSTLHYQGEAHRFAPHAFRLGSERGIAADWPLGYEELAPYYERIEALLGVAGDPGNPFKAPRGPYPYPAHPLSSVSLHVGEGARRLGWSHLPNPLAILPEPRPERAPCHYCNGCVRGCMVGAKGSTDVAVLPEAERTGHLTLRSDFHVHRLEHDADGRITGVIGTGPTGREERIAARAVVLATGAIETPRVLLNSGTGRFSAGIGNAHGQVGRYLMEHLYVTRWALFDAPLESYAGIPFDSRVWDFNGAGGGGQPAGYVLGQYAGIFEGPVGNALEVAPGFGLEHRRTLRRRFGSAVELWGTAEQLPRFENRVTLSDETDRFGVPLARIETRLDALDLEVVSEMWSRLGELAEAARAERLLGQLTTYDTPYAAHVGGSCRMGTNPEDSVVDPWGSVHAHPNLVVADASLLVTQGSGDSPSLTIQALALRAAEALVHRSRRLEL